jgi:hypothetical protein
MVLETGDIAAIIIALAGACVVIVTSIRAHGRLMQENQMLRKRLVELEYNQINGRG